MSDEMDFGTACLELFGCGRAPSEIDSIFGLENLAAHDEIVWQWSRGYQPTGEYGGVRDILELYNAPRRAI